MLIRNYLVYVGLWLLIKLLLVEVNCQTSPTNPQMRNRHTATLVGKRLYILGGRSDDETLVGSIGKQFIYRDFNDPLNVRGLFWQNLTSTNTIVPPHYSAASVIGGANNQTIFLYWGNNPDHTQPSIYTFDNMMIWNIQNTTNDTGTRRWELEGIVDDKGNMYLFGGENTEDAAVTALSDMLILDTTSLIWRTGSSVNAPPPRRNYGATYLPNNKSIIYMGGLGFGDSHIELNEVHLYDTVNDAWSTNSTTGKIPSSRDSFSVVLGLDAQRIILYGGHESSTDGVAPLNKSLYVLDLTNFTWYIPNISGDLPQSGRFWHKANVIGKYMVVSFGSGYNQSIDPDLLLLDISDNDNYIWTDEFDPSAATSPTSSSPSPTTSPTSQQSNKNPVIIGAVVGSVGGIGLMIGIFMLYRWNKNRDKKSIIEIPSER